MNIAIICSNYFNIKKDTANGTAIFDYSLITHLAKTATTDSVTVFASGASELPVRVESIDHDPSSAHEGLVASGKNVLYEQTLLAKAFSMQDTFDVYHVNIGDGDIALPFSPFVQKPILITIHHLLDTDYMRKFFSFYKAQRNVHFISTSNAQRKVLPDLNYAATIYHGVDPDVFAFDARGGEHIMWAGRAIPEKGIHHVVDVANATKKQAKLFGIPRKEHGAWLKDAVLDKLSLSTFESGRHRHELIEHFQQSKVFLFPVSYEESFGLVLIEAMSCGTPVIAFARGSIPEVIEDGKTGFIVNESDEDVRGDWTVKKTGVAGLLEAVERLYALSDEEYSAMRLACRERVMKHFTIDHMVDQYRHMYKKIADDLSVRDTL